MIWKQLSVYLDNYEPTLIQGLLEEKLSGIVWSIFLDCDTSAVMLVKVR